ncbi:ABC transporter permease [Chrysiogenes arsenatis]|uniref:ABC transporter permease n=1 Tax=Chrysiogenes arsenatis TaxID=309797 RepID=UPI0004171B05|nr:FtsX-like permease family protein [Chrysiogenes arsenatis]
MNLSLQLRLAFRFLYRERKSRALQILSAALVLAVTALSTVLFLGDRVSSAMRYQALSMLGADITITSPQPLATEIVQTAYEKGLRFDQIAELPTMLFYRDEMVLVSLKAVSSGYPHRGAVLVSTALHDEPHRASTPPPAGTLWVEPGVLSLLGAQLGDSVEIGTLALQATHHIEQEPDRATGGFLSVNPRVIIGWGDLHAAELVVPGSRIQYRYLFSGDASQVSEFQAWVTAQLGPHQRILELSEEQPGIASALTRVRHYLALATVVTVLLSGIAIALAAHEYTRSQALGMALFRCIGASRAEITRHTVFQVLTIGVVASTVGLLLGYGLQMSFIAALRPLLPSIIPAASLWPVGIGYAAGIGVLGAFSLPSLFTLRTIPPIVLMRQQAYLAKPTLLLLLVAGGIAIGGLTFFAAPTVLVAALFLLAIMGLFLGYYLIVTLLLRLAKKSSTRIPTLLKAGLRSLVRHPAAAKTQIIAFTISFSALAIVTLLRTDLLATWVAQIPDDAPNYFAINIQPHETEPFLRVLSENGIDAVTLFPVVRGRLTGINGMPARQAVPESAQEDNTLRRELNLTWGDTLPAGNLVTAGTWETDRMDAQMPHVSLESGVAERLHLALGDTLEFTIGHQTVPAIVGSIRSVEWNSFQPNFYVIFPSGTLDTFATAYMTSIYIDPSKRHQVRELLRPFPSVTLFDVNHIVAQVDALLRQTMLVVEAVFLFVLAAGVILLFASILGSSAARLQENALLRSFGASRRYLYATNIGEFGILGFFSGILAALSAEAFTALLYGKLFDLTWSPQWIMWVTLIPAATVIIIGAGFLASYSVLRSNPLDLLRN